MRAGGGNFDITTIYFDSLNYIRLRRFIRYIKRSFLRVAAVYSSKYGPVIAPRLTIRDEGFIECLIGAIWSDLDSFPARQFRRPTRSTRIRYRSSNDISRDSNLSPSTLRFSFPSFCFSCSIIFASNLSHLAQFIREKY